MTAAARNDVFVWTNLTPRAAVAYAFGSTYHVTARGSYSLFASQLPGAQAAFASPIQPAFVAYNAVDPNDDGVAQASELALSSGIQSSAGFDARNPSSTTPVNRVGDTHAPLTHELIAGFDDELTASLCDRHAHVSKDDRPALVAADWRPRPAVHSGRHADRHAAEIGSFSVPLFALRPRSCRSAADSNR